MYRTGVDAVVVNYRSPEDLEGFLAAWKAFRPGTTTALTVVNVAPNDEDKEIAAASGDIAMQVNYETNVGYAQACNDAASVGNAEVIAFFNADTRITDGSVDLCYQGLMSNSEWGVLGPRQVDDHNRLTHAGIFGTNTEPHIRSWMQPDTGHYSEIRSDAVTVMGSIYFIKRQVWEELWNCPTYQEAVPGAPGAFLPTPHYYEETFCSYHARAHGWKCVYFGLAKMVHRWHKASPIGGFADTYFKTSQEEFRRVCDAHNIPRD
jgi:GT2 family glycosyltransferase